MNKKQFYNIGTRTTASRPSGMTSPDPRPLYSMSDLALMNQKMDGTTIFTLSNIIDGATEETNIF